MRRAAEEGGTQRLFLALLRFEMGLANMTAGSQKQRSASQQGYLVLRPAAEYAAVINIH